LVLKKLQNISQGKKISEEEMGFFLNNRKYSGYKVVHPMNNAPEAR
jgi:hypothetical protein